MEILLLTPTLLEASFLPDPPKVVDLLSRRAKWRGRPLAVVGFGPVDSACGALEAFFKYQDFKIAILIGLAGTYDEELCPKGDVVHVNAFRFHGIGTGTDHDLRVPEEMNLPSEANGLHPYQSLEPAGFRLPGEGDIHVQALSVCAASQSLEQARNRKQRYPEAMIEEMEGYAVARAARHWRVRLGSLRAISNTAGDRDKTNWNTEQAMRRLANTLEEELENLK